MKEICTFSQKNNCEKLILEKSGLNISAMIVLADDLINAINSAPDWWDNDKESKHNAIFIIPPITVEQILHDIGEIKPEYEKVSYFERVIFWSAPLKTFSKTRWSKRP